MIASLLSVAVNIVLCIVLVRWMGFSGLAFATSLSAFLQFILLLYLLSKYIKGVGWSSLLRGFASSLLASICMAAFLIFGMQMLEDFWNSHEILLRIFLLTCALILAVVVYGLIAKALGLEEFISFWNFLHKKFHKRRSLGNE